MVPLFRDLERISSGLMNPRTSNYNPSDSHSRNDHDDKSFEVLSHIRSRKLYSDGKESSSENDAHDFERNGLGRVAPRAGVKDTRNVGTHDDAYDCSQDHLVDE